jgi:hypothetical protein
MWKGSPMRLATFLVAFALAVAFGAMTGATIALEVGLHHTAPTITR